MSSRFAQALQKSFVRERREFPIELPPPLAQFGVLEIFDCAQFPVYVDELPGLDLHDLPGGHRLRLQSPDVSIGSPAKPGIGIKPEARNISPGGID
jgi:hypothetical protein